MKFKHNTTDYYCKLPNYMFHTSKKQLGVNEREVSIMEYFNFDKKVLVILEHLYINTNRYGVSIFTLGRMIEDCGYKPKNGKGETNEAFKDILNELDKIGIIELNSDILKTRINNLNECILNMFERNDDDKDIKFFQVYKRHRDVIMGYDKGDVKNVDLYVYFCFIVSGIHTRSRAEGSMEQGGGRAEVTYPSYDTIGRKLGIGDATIKKYNDILVSLDVLRIGNAGIKIHKKDRNKKKVESPNVYTIHEYNEQHSQHKIKEAIKLYKTNHIDWNFLNTRDYATTDKKRDGYISMMQHIVKSRDLTDIENKKLKDCIEDRDNSREFVERKTLLKTNSNMLLSEIYYNKFKECENEEGEAGTIDERKEIYARINYNERNYIKFKQLEIDLHLVDNFVGEFNSFDRLIVKYDCYVKAIISYKDGDTIDESVGSYFPCDEDMVAREESEQEIIDLFY